MPSNLQITLATHDAAAARLREREAVLISEIDEIRLQLKTLVDATNLITQALSDAPFAEAETTERGEVLALDDKSSEVPRARIGEQRYLMLIALRQFGCLTQGDIVEATQLGYKRVKDQMVSDLKTGVVVKNEDGFSLTEIGEDLLLRFETYRREAGKELWELPIAADDNSANRRAQAEKGAAMMMM